MGQGMKLNPVAVIYAQHARCRRGRCGCVGMSGSASRGPRFARLASPSQLRAAFWTLELACMSMSCSCAVANCTCACCLRSHGDHYSMKSGERGQGYQTHCSHRSCCCHKPISDLRPATGSARLRNGLSEPGALWIISALALLACGVTGSGLKLKAHTRQHRGGVKSLKTASSVCVCLRDEHDIILCALQIPQMYALLKEFRYLVVIDPDAYFATPEVPLHLLLGRWGWKLHSRCVTPCNTVQTAARMCRAASTHGRSCSRVCLRSVESSRLGCPFAFCLIATRHRRPPLRHAISCSFTSCKCGL